MQDRKENHLYAEGVREFLMSASCQVRGAALQRDGLRSVNEWDFTVHTYM